VRIVLELVPRDAESLQAQLRDAAPLAAVAAINVPDLPRFALRGPDAALLVRAAGYRAIPHVRAMDVDLRRPWPPLAALDAAGIDEVLVVTGDPPTDMRHVVTGAGVLDVIRMLKRERPHWRVHAALDPYRAGFSAERDYALRKLDAGASGLFTQPFFDVRLLAVWRDLLPDVPIHWGVTSVTSEASARYWATRNHAVFPTAFRPTLAHARSFAREALTFARGEGVDLYFMPIRVSIGAWLGDLLG
jgi:methylenetetrahydrofolate reductase (NADPH)